MARPRKGQQASERQEHGKGQALPEHVYTLVCACARARVFTCAGGGVCVHVSPSQVLHPPACGKAQTARVSQLL